MTGPTRIDIFSDTVCPWCFLGKRRFDLALLTRPQYEPLVTWRPFELNPDLPLSGVEREPGKMAEAETDLTALGEAIGIAFRFDMIERTPNSRRSHLLIAHAARFGRQAEVKDRIMQAYFEEGCDIGNIEELVRLGLEAGLVESEARNALILRRGQDGVVAAERHAQVLGITGVPTFVFDGQYTIAGAQEVAILSGVFDQVAELAAARTEVE